MLKRRYRITLDKDFEKLFETGRSFHTPFFVLRLKESGTLWSRFAIVVSNKVSKKATERNRLKRQFRETIRASLANIKEGYDIVVIVKTKCLHLPYHEIEEQFKRALHTTHIYQDGTER